MATYSTFALTLRPRAGVTDEQIEDVLKWCQNACKWYAIVTEKEDHARHIHAAIWLKKPSTRSNVNFRILSLKGFQALDNVEQHVAVRKGTSIMYNFDWNEEYMTKGDSTEIIAEELGSEEEMAELFPAKDDKRAAKKFLGSPWLVNMEKLWYLSPFKDSTPNMEKVGIVMHCAMYVDRVIEAILDPRKYKQHQIGLLHFIKREVPEYKGLEEPPPKTDVERMIDNENKLKVLEFQDQLEEKKESKILQIEAKKSQPRLK